MASVQKYGAGYSVRYRVSDPLGKVTMKRVSGFRTKEEAWEAARKLEAASNAGTNVHGDKASCGLIMERWFAEHVLSTCAKTTISRYSASITVLSKIPIYNEPIRNLTPIRFSQLLIAIQEREKGRIISPVTAFGYLDPLRLSLSWAASQGIIPRNPIQGYKRQTALPRVQKILDEQDIDELVDAAYEKPFYIPLLLAVYGGLRREECAGLLWDQVDMKRGTISIVRAETATMEGKRIEKDVKTAHSMRTINMPDFVMDELKAAAKVSTYVCIAPSGEPYALDSYRQAVHRLIGIVNKHRAGTSVSPIPDVNFHDLRHTHAAMLIKMGVQPKVIQERLGHASIRITMDLYGYLMTGIQAGVADALNAQFQGKSSRHKSRHTGSEISPKTSVCEPANEIQKSSKVQIFQRLRAISG